MREQFEKLPEISRLIEKRNMIFNEEISRYGALGYADDLSLIDDIGFVSGAWYAFQEQQKQLDLINQYTAAQGASIKMLNDERIKQQKNKDAIKQKLHDIYNVCDEDETVAMLLDEIQELIK